MIFSNLFKKLVLGALVLPSLALACINDVDSRYFETKNFPEIRDLIMGKFPTHGKDWYEWRIRDRTEKIKKDPTNLNLYDDLAIAYEKTGQSDKAIEVLEGQRSQNPHRYETLANLGTVYIHAGQYQKGVDLLKEGMVINPDAHYGREKYQILLVEYLISKYPEGKFPFPISTEESSFYHFLAKQPGWPPNYSEAEYKELALALRGLFGMLRFGNSDSPILLEEISNLFKARADIGVKFNLNDAIELNNVFSSMAMDKLKSQKTVDELKVIADPHPYYRRYYYFQDRVKEETEDAAQYVAGVREFEKELLVKSTVPGVDIEKLFNEKYYDQQAGQTVNELFDGIAGLDATFAGKKNSHNKSDFLLGLLVAAFVAIPSIWLRVATRTYNKSKLLGAYDIIVILTLPVILLFSFALRNSLFLLFTVIMLSILLVPIFFWQKKLNTRYETQT